MFTYEFFYQLPILVYVCAYVLTAIITCIFLVLSQLYYSSGNYISTDESVAIVLLGVFWPLIYLIAAVALLVHYFPSAVLGAVKKYYLERSIVVKFFAVTLGYRSCITREDVE